MQEGTTGYNAARQAALRASLPATAVLMEAGDASRRGLTSTHRRIRWSPTRDAAQEIHTPDRPDLRHSADKRREWRGVQAVLSHPLELTSVTSAGILGCDRVLLLSFGLVLACRRYLTIHPA